MLEKLENELQELRIMSPWRKRVGTNRNIIMEGLGAPEPDEYMKWQTDIVALENQIAEEEARRQIDRP